MDALIDLLIPDYFMPHGHCYLWTPGLLWLQVVTNALIAAAYVAISVTLGYLVYRVRDLPFKLVYLAFGTFIIACAFTHALDVWTIWTPAYWIDGAVRAVTAVASVGTALLLPPLVPRAIALARGAKLAHDRGIQIEAAMRDLENLYVRLKEVDELKTDFFANVSHELRTPLTLILGPVERLRDAANLTEAQRRDLEVVARNGRVLVRHVDDLLELARLDAGRLEPAYAALDVAALVRRIAGDFAVLGRERRLTVEVRTPAELRAEVDPARLEKVLLNLLGNAVKFTPEGGRIRCELAAQGSGADARLVLEVADSGPGVPPAQRELVFERFRQGDRGATRAHGGTGLGLSIVRELVRAHRGTVRLDEAPEGGARFTVILPTRAPAGATVAVPEPAAGGGDGGAADVAPEPGAAGGARAAAVAAVAAIPSGEPDERGAEVSAGPDGVAEGEPLVLVAEDHADLRRYLVEVLGAGRRVLTAADGERALALARAHRPDLVVTDVMMPRLSGDQLVAALRARPETADVPVLVLTAKSDDALRQELLAHGAQDYVVKPFAPAELSARADNLIRMQRARRVLQAELATQAADLEALAAELAGRRRELQGALELAEVARDQAVRASAAKTAFQNLISHELRTPLTAIQLQLELMVADGALGASGGRVDKMQRAAGRLVGLVDSLLEHARLESGGMAPRRELVDVDALIGEILAEARPRAEDKGLRLEADLAAGTIESDGRLVGVIVRNLVDNALKYTRHGLVEVRAARDAAGGVRVEVRDTGPGIAPEDRRRVFDAFEQLEDPRRKHAPGVGLGLALVRELTAALGGAVELTSVVGEGSTFTVTLPAPPAP